MRRKIVKRRRLESQLPVEVFDKLDLMAGEYETITSTLIKLINFQFSYQVKKGIIKLPLTEKEKEQQELANFNWLEGDSND